MSKFGGFNVVLKVSNEFMKQVLRYRSVKARTIAILTVRIGAETRFSLLYVSGCRHEFCSRKCVVS